MASNMSVEDRIALVKSQLHETLKFEIFENVLRKGERPPVIYWGTATTGRPHCAYFVPMVKLGHFLRAGCTVKVLLADIHGFLDNLKAPIELVNFRAEYYQFVIKSMLKAIGVPIDRLQFVMGSSYQLSPKYTMDLFRLSSVVTEHDAKKAGAEVVKQVDNAPLSGLIYPLMQALDEEHLGVDAQFGGVDQRKIFTMAQEQLPRIGYKERAHFMNSMVPGLAGGKMSSSDPDSKIDILENADGVKKKLKKAFAAPKEVEGNGMISFVEYVLLPVSELRDGKAKFVVERREGEPLVYDNIETLKQDYIGDTLTPQLIKSAMTAALNDLLKPIQEEFLASQAWQDIEQKAYPPPPAPEKKKKKEKKIGTRAPNANVEAKPDGSVKGKDSDQVNVSTDASAAIEKLDLGQKATET